MSTDYKQLKKLASSNDVPAQRQLAIYLWNRDNRSTFNQMFANTDTHKALRWFKKAASQNDIYSLLFLTLHYFMGDVFNKDEKKGIECLERAATNGSQFAAALLTRIFGESWCVAKFEDGCHDICQSLVDIQPSLETTHDVQRKLQWIKYLVERFKDKEAMNQLGIIYFSGSDGMKQDITLARQLLKQAVEKGSVTAIPIYASMLMQGLGGRKDEEKAVEYLEKGMEKEEQLSCIMLANYYLRPGYTIEQSDYAFALLHCFPDENHADPEALYLIGKAYLEGDITIRYPEKARFFMNMSAEKGHPKAREIIANWDKYCRETAICHEPVGVPEYYVTDANIANFLQGNQPDNLPDELYDRICRLITNYRQRIKQGDAAACISMACLYDNGVVLMPDLDMGDDCLLLAEDLGNVDAMRLLVARYSGNYSAPLVHTDIHEKDLNEAITHATRCLKATRKGADAKVVGDLYYRIHDYRQAINYYNEAELLGKDCNKLINRCFQELQMLEMKSMHQQIEDQQDLISSMHQRMQDMQQEAAEREKRLRDEIREYASQAAESSSSQSYEPFGSGKCGFGDISCAGGGGQCGINIGCAGGGRDSFGSGKCGFGDLSCAGGGGQCGINIGCAGGGA